MTRKRVLVVGSGLAGLTTAYLLRKEECEVWLVEKSDKLGFHSSSVDIPISGGTNEVTGEKDESLGEKAKWVVDVPMRSFQGGYYPLLIALYKHLEITMIPTSFTFSFSTMRQGLKRIDMSTYFIYSGSNGLSRPSLPLSSFESIYALLKSVIRFIHSFFCFILLLFLAGVTWHRISITSHKTTLDDISRRFRFFGFDTFIADLVVPIFASVGTMTISDIMQTPLPCITDYIFSTVGTDHYSLGNSISASTIASKLSFPVKSQGKGYLRLGCWVRSLVSGDDGIRVGFEDGDQIFVDKVVISTQASSAKVLLTMLESSLQSEEKGRVGIMLKALEEVEYRETIIVTHRDKTTLPSKGDIRDINFLVPLPNVDSRFISDGLKAVNRDPPYFPSLPGSLYVMATHVISPPKHLSNQQAVLQTTNPVVPINRDTVLGVARLERALPVRNPKLFDRLHPKATDGLVYLAGSYAYPGIPLLEGCVGSARRAASAVLGQDMDDIGNIDWTAGRGGLVGRIWRYRRRGIVV